MKHLYLEDVPLDKEYITPSRTITEADIINFAGITGDFSPVHVDEESAKKTEFKSRIAHGLLGLSIIGGLKNLSDFNEDGAIASLGWTIDFLKPIFPGDTVTCKFKVTKKRRSKTKPDRGILFIECNLVNQKSELVQKGEHRLMVYCKGSGIKKTGE